jgi:hypothetical protein
MVLKAHEEIERFDASAAENFRRPHEGVSVYEMGTFPQGRNLLTYLHIASINLSAQLMREMGFEYDPSTAGSSVRFDPPDRNDVVSATSSPCELYA